MKISIATSYYNRKSQFINTLKTIKKSAHKDIEIIVTDDCSAPEHRLEDLLEEYPFLKIIRLESQDRWYTNPCVPFNKAIKATTGDIVIIQNPECLHVGDVLTDVLAKVNEKNYLSYAVYSLSKEVTEYITDLPYENEHIFHMIKSQIEPMNNVNYAGEGNPCWYNHSIHRPAGYHFLVAMTKGNLTDLGGFDERFSNGIGFDDDEFLFRVRLKGLSVQIHDDPFALHQWHYSENNFFAKSGNIMEAVRRNENLFKNGTCQNPTWRVS